VGDLLLVRHCTSSGQAADAPLTDEGLRDAEALAGELRAFPVDHAVSSPYLRARQTVEPFTRGSGLDLEVDVRLRERELAGALVADFLPALERSFTDFDYRLPGGESSREAQARGRSALDQIAAVGHRLALVATHGNLLTLLLHSIDPRFGFDSWRRLSNPDLFLLTDDGRGSFGIERVWPAS